MTTSVEEIHKLKGPIVVFGAGGFIGINLLNTILQVRNDVYGVSHDPQNNWRFIANDLPQANRIACDLNDPSQITLLIKSHVPKTIFNLAAYGAYSKQADYSKIYTTNLNASIHLIESAKKAGFDAYVQAGTSSEYGINSVAPAEDDELIPNSHYAVSKVAMSYVAKYYGQVEELPVIHLRLYSAYGPWEEPDRLMPMLVSKARAGHYPPLVNPDTTRDYIYVMDVVDAFIKAAFQASQHHGETYNIGTGVKTTIKELADMISTICKIEDQPSFGSMENRNWDVVNDWYANASRARDELKWTHIVDLRKGLENTLKWQKEIGYEALLQRYGILCVEK